MSNHSIGWLGTGRMGAVMAGMLLDSGADVTVWNRTVAKTEPLAAKGAKVAGTVAELADRDIVFVMVSASADLIAVTKGDGGLLTADQKPKVIVDCSTVSAEASAEVRAAAEAAGVAFLASPISGNPHMVAEGRAAIVTSGPKETFDEVRRYLDVMAPTVVWAGPGEECRLVKICHNLLLGMITQALVEVTALAEKGGVTRAAFTDFINGSVLGSTFIQHKSRAIVARDYTPTFNNKMLRKDYDLGLGAARTLEVPMPLSSMVHQLIQTAIGHGFAEEDYAALYEVEARAAGLPLRD
ncbi:NAD(P)-dependent oxidoreductase [Sinosporangium siamense]|uniref:3-hydroxyisobutyrate dehydrogenase n=2 Tax=Sinosporangium siamense TaxID=1367973 RepID=A0A919V8B9_9ACTN|nr:3-hydroxyisobutyrate dehydrogenase [Sinosporangium siamense]